MNCPLLTIGIPTFNRAKLLGHTLESVLRQIPSELTNRVDILISDNASTDDTEAAVQAFGTKYPVRITYSRNTENIGYDRNVDRLFKKASGNYVWLLGDDDTLKDGAILHILDLLTQHPKLKAILVNFDAYDAQLEILQDQKEISRDFLCTNPEMFLSNAASKYSLTSSLILNRISWNQEDIEKGMGCHFIHVYGLFKILLRGDSYIVGRPLVNYRQGSVNITTSSGDAVLATGLSACKVTSMMTEMGHDKKIVRQLLKESRRYIYNLVRDAKVLGIQNKSKAARSLLDIYSTPTVWFKLIPMLYCPDGIYQPFYRVKKRASAFARSLRQVGMRS